MKSLVFKYWHRFTKHECKEDCQSSCNSSRRPIPSVVWLFPSHREQFPTTSKGPFPKRGLQSRKDTWNSNLSYKLMRGLVHQTVGVYTELSLPLPSLLCSPKEKTQHIVNMAFPLGSKGPTLRLRPGFFFSLSGNNGHTHECYCSDLANGGQANRTWFLGKQSRVGVDSVVSLSSDCGGLT